MTNASNVRGTFAAVVAGLLFGAGLGISGMTRTSKILGFLDVTGAWDPSLVFVMVGAVGVHFVAVRIAKRRTTTLLGAPMPPPPTSKIDAQLILGAAIFGVGWGLGGYCPGPAIVSASAGWAPAIVFVVAMALGMVTRHATLRTTTTTTSTTSTPAASVDRD